MYFCMQWRHWIQISLTGRLPFSYTYPSMSVLLLTTRSKGKLSCRSSSGRQLKGQCFPLRFWINEKLWPFWTFEQTFLVVLGSPVILLRYMTEISKKNYFYKCLQIGFDIKNLYTFRGSLASSHHFEHHIEKKSSFSVIAFNMIDYVWLERQLLLL